MIEINSIENEIKKLVDEYADDDSTIDYEKLINDFGIDIEGIERELTNYLPKLTFNFSTSHPDAVEPNYAYPTDSGFDLHSVEEISIESFGRALVPTGLHLDIPENYEIQVRSKKWSGIKTRTYGFKFSWNCGSRIYR